MRLVLLPGLDGTGQLFAPLLQALPQHVQVTVVAYPRKERHSYNELGDRVRSLLPAKEPYLIVAESFSGPIAVRLAAAAPRNLLAVVLCASFVHIPRNFIVRAAFTLLSRFIFMVSVPRWAVRYFLSGSDAPEELLTLFYQVISSVAPSLLSYRLRIALAADERQALRDTSVPLLYLLPTRDRLLGRSSLDLMLKCRADVSTASIEAPHLVLQRRPMAALRQIDRWMEERGLGKLSG